MSGKFEKKFRDQLDYIQGCNYNQYLENYCSILTLSHITSLFDIKFELKYDTNYFFFVFGKIIFVECEIRYYEYKLVKIQIL